MAAAPAPQLCNRIQFREERMDGNEFDLISRKLGALATRRRTLGGLAAGLLGAAGVAGMAEAKNKGKSASGKHKKKGVGKQQACGGVGCVCTASNPTCSTGSCVPGNDVDFCGNSGNQCDTCAAGQVCAPVANGGTCTSSLNCRVGTCQTGVSGTQTCVARGSTTSCGQGLFNTNTPGTSGNVCNPPCAAGQSCPSNDANATCSGTTCASICPTGCCTNFGGTLVCTAGTEDFACGNSGGQCVDCGSGTCNQVAGGGGVCSNAACSPQNCAGCCTAAGVCAAGTANGACGVNGAACTACAANETCQNNACVAVVENCGPANCTGCCSDATTCVSTPSDAACGIGGGLCVACTGKKHCKNGKCKRHRRHHH